MTNNKYVLENDILKVEICNVGAEVCSIWNKKMGIEYIWQGDPKSWKRSFPILFPIVGRLRNDSYTHEDKNFTLTQHGFARDSYFIVEKKLAIEISFLLNADSETLQNYPFDFGLVVNYQLIDNMLDITYKVKNLSGDQMMYYSIGGHPGFNIPFLKNTCFEDYYFSLEASHERKRYMLNEDSFLVPGVEGEIPESGKFPLDHELFKNEAVIMNLVKREESFFIRSDKSQHAIEIRMIETPLMDFWSSYPNTGGFLCVEPCWGIADPVEGSSEIKDKPGIQKLEGLGEGIHRYCILFH